MDVSNQYNLHKELSNLENRVSPNPRIRGTVYLGDRLYILNMEITSGRFQQFNTDN